MQHLHRRPRRLLSGLGLRGGALAVALVLFAPAAAAAQSSATHGTSSRASSPYFGAAPRSPGPMVAASGVSLAAGLSLFLADPSGRPVTAEPSTTRTANWRGGILMDERVRDAMRFGSDGARERAATVSDALLGGLVVNALAVDALAIPLARGENDRALDATAAYSLALGTTLVLGEIVKNAVSRARPFERYCFENGNPGCGDDDALSSFYSLHSAVAFTSAGFSCAMHVGRGLYDDPVADATACGTSLAAATAVALLRVASDRHYLTDVLVGSALGLAVGIIVPLLIVPQRPPNGGATLDSARASAAPDTSPRAVIMPMFAPGPSGAPSGSLGSSTIGLSIAGTF